MIEVILEFFFEFIIGISEFLVILFQIINNLIALDMYITLWILRWSQVATQAMNVLLTLLYTDTL